jgi:hypothetical protein
MRVHTILCAAVLAFAALPAAGATPKPGGANQMQAVSGTVGRTLWNGKFRLQITQVRAETPTEAADLHPSAEQKVMHIEGLLRNGTQDKWTVRPSYTLADKDDVTQDAGVLDLQAVTLAQGAAARQKIRFLVPKDFQPVKLLVGANKTIPGPPFRIVLLPSTQ